MKTLFTLIAALVFGAGIASADPVNKNCPVSGKEGDATVVVKYAKKIGFCCDKCKGKFVVLQVDTMNLIGIINRDSPKLPFNVLAREIF